MVDSAMWEPIKYEEAWDQFEAAFGFRPGMDPATWPAIDEPAGSITYDISACWNGHP